MTRKAFIKICGMLGVTLPFQVTSTPSKNNEISQRSSEKVVIIGAGAAGLTAGHLLSQKGIEYQILEATPAYGGRMKKTDDFADFPIPLGAEWLTVGTGIFDEIVNDNSFSVNVNTVGYNHNDNYGLWKKDKLLLSNLGSFNYRKFVNGTWFDFFEEYIIPSVSQNVIYNSFVSSINYTGDKVFVRTQNAEYSADKVIVTVPLKIIQNGSIEFTPSLPDNKLVAIKNAVVWDGIKVFLEFSERFYPTFTDFKITPKTSGQLSYYDAAYGQNTNKNILGLFAVGAPAQNYILLDENDLKSYILNELDNIFSNQATPNYISHIVQNWSEEPHIEGAYLNDYEDWKRVRTLFESIEDKIYFAGEAYTSGNDWGGVHAAAQAAKETIEQIVS